MIILNYPVLQDFTMDVIDIAYPHIYVYLYLMSCHILFGSVKCGRRQSTYANQF